MSSFLYQPFDFDKPGFRLVRLLQDLDGDDIICEIFNACLKPDDDLIDFEALSYTWGGNDVSQQIWLNGKKFKVTVNLYDALCRLRHADKDRILWVDAICIDQENPKERGHQVRQMASIYGKAMKVIVWLGHGTFETDFLMDGLKAFEEECRKQSCSLSKIYDRHFIEVWQMVHQQHIHLNHPMAIRWQTEGLASLLSRSWFDRVWILQEITHARAADIVCGTKSVSACIFALTPQLIEYDVTTHCQAVLDLMPGPSRISMWTAKHCNLRKLLEKLKAKASDPRDKVYALLSISSDAADSDRLRPDYELSEEEVVQKTLIFLCGLENDSPLIRLLPRWTMEGLMNHMTSLGEDICKIALKQESLAFALSLNIDINFKDVFSRTLLYKVASTGTVDDVKILLSKRGIDVNALDSYYRSPLFVAELDQKVEVLLSHKDIDANAFDYKRTSPLSCANDRGDAHIGEVLINHKEVDVNVQTWLDGTTGLNLVFRLRRKDIVVALLRHKDIDINRASGLFGGRWLSPLATALKKQHVSTLTLLIRRKDLVKDREDGKKLLALAREKKDVVLENLLLERELMMDTNAPETISRTTSTEIRVATTSEPVAPIENVGLGELMTPP